MMAASKATRVLATLVFLASIVAAQNITTYIAECTIPCITSTLNSTSFCKDIDDNTCLCDNMLPIIGSSRGCFIQSCASNPDARQQTITGWQTFCVDTRSTVNETDISAPNLPIPSPTTSTAIPTSQTSTTAPSNPNASDSEQIEDTTNEDPSSQLSSGAKAGIGLGAGLGSLFVIGSFIYLGFHIGRRRPARHSLSSDVDDDPERKAGGFSLSSPRPNNSDLDDDDNDDLEEVHPSMASRNNSRARDKNISPVSPFSGAAGGVGGLGIGTDDKPQLDGNAISELSPEERVKHYAEMHGSAPPERSELFAMEVANELPVNERPAELWERGYGMSGYGQPPTEMPAPNVPIELDAIESPIIRNNDNSHRRT